TPVRIQACGMRPLSNAFETVRTIASWPIRSAKLEGRYLRASTRYEDAPAAGAAPRSRPGSAGGVTSFIRDLHPVSFRKPRSGCPESITPKPHGTERAGLMDSGLATSSRPGMTKESEWEADERPDPCSLGLLPSGPDPVGEWFVHRQPPASY